MARLWSLHMTTHRVAFTTVLIGCCLAWGEASPVAAQAAIPDAIAAKGETVVLTLHAEGAQVYDCKAGEGSKVAWQFREPIATLMQDGKTIGRANGATANDIPWLKLEAVEARGTGALAGVTSIQRINTQGGQLDGACEKAGATRAVPYAADYVFLKK